MDKLGNHLLLAREHSGLSQLQLAAAAGINQSGISEFEKGRRLPSLKQCLNLAAVLKVSLQWLLSGANRPGDELADIAFQLHDIGIVDLHVENARVPGMFRPNEEVVALALAGASPPARILEAMPAVLAWNHWNPFLLRTFGRVQGKRVEARIGWLADITLTIHEGQGFPGGCSAKRVLESYVQHVKPPQDIDSFAYSRAADDLPPVSLRWRMHYPAPLSVFRQRADRLNELRTR